MSSNTEPNQKRNAAPPAANEEGDAPPPAVSSVWVSSKDKAWMAMFDQLAEFKRQNGHFHLTKVHTDPNGSLRKLANWIARQRLAMDKMPANRKQLLDDIGFYWDPHDHSWFQTFNELKAIYDRVGHCNMPATRADITENNKCYERFIPWFRKQRIQYLIRQRGLKSSMSDLRLKNLQSIGFSFRLESEEERKHAEKLANDALVRRNLRFIPPSYTHRVLHAFREEASHYAATQEVRPVVVENEHGVKEFIHVEDDGAWRLMKAEGLESLIKGSKVMSGAGITTLSD